MVVPDALSRAVSLIDVSRFVFTKDEEFIRLKNEVENDPSNHSDHLIKDSTLYRYTKKGRRGKRVWKIVIPIDFRQEIFVECHTSILAAHGGYLKTLDRIKRSYYWKNMNIDIAKFVKECEKCKEVKATNKSQKSPMGDQRKAKYPWHMVSADFMGPFPLSNRNNRHLLVVIDKFSKFVLMKPMKVACAKETVEFIKERIITEFGVPEIIIMDNGPQFKSIIFTQFLEQYGISGWVTASYHPQANPTEAVNKTIINAIKTYIENDRCHQEWDANLNWIQCALNTSIHSATNETPYYINFGWNMILNGKAHTILDPTDQNRPTTEEEFDDIRNNVKKCLEQAYDKAKSEYDKNSREIQYKPGQIIWKKNYKLSNAGDRYAAKLAPRYVKCRIRTKLGNNTYQLEDLNGKLLGSFSTSDSKE